MNKISKPLVILFLVALAIFFFWYGRHIPFHEQWPLYEAQLISLKIKVLLQLAYRVLQNKVFVQNN